MNFECTINKPITHVGFSARSWLRHPGGYRQTIFGVSIDVCAEMRNGKSDNLMAETFKKYILTESNANHSCPYDGTVYFRNIGITSGWVLNTFVPVGKYRVDFRFYDPRNNATLFLVQVFKTVNK